MPNPLAALTIGSPKKKMGKELFFLRDARYLFHPAKSLSLGVGFRERSDVKNASNDYLKRLCFLKSCCFAQYSAHIGTKKSKAL